MFERNALVSGGIALVPRTKGHNVQRDFSSIWNDCDSRQSGGAGVAHEGTKDVPKRICL